MYWFLGFIVGVNMFERNISLIGENIFNKFKTKKILIVGLGGVGGYALETLVRSGFENIDIIDFDKLTDFANKFKETFIHIYVKPLSK